MPRKLDERLAEALKKYHPEPTSAVWDCHGTWVVLHKDVEFMAAKAGIKFGLPQVIEGSGERKVVAMIVSASLGEVMDWATGEAAPSNNKNSYPYAMAEKRARDRVAIKLLGLHGAYSEDEADEFKDNTRRTETSQPQATDILIVAERTLEDAAQKGTDELKEAWFKLAPATRELFGGIAPKRLKDLAAECDRRKAA